MVYLVAALQDSGTTDAGAALGAGLGIGTMVITVAILLVVIASMWKVFEKAGEPGWAAIVPIYNMIVLLKIAGKPAWWVVLMFIPFVNFIVGIIAILALAKNFGKGAGFGLGLLFLAPVFYPILAWGDSRYQPQP